MQKIYQNKTVLEAFFERMEFVFQEFDNIYIAFSGGKDSGVLLNLVIKYMEDHGIQRPIGVFHQDFEAQYQATSDYVEKTFLSLPDCFEKFWCCLPFAVRNAMSQNHPFWYPWDPDLKDLWVRPMPEYDFVYNLSNSPFFERDMDDPRMRKGFARWYHGQRSGKTICLVGVRSDESLTRYSAIVNKRNPYKDQKWITKNYKDIYSASPLYDWTVEDVWTANARFNFSYNPLYDLFYKAGIPLNDMRVASPFHEWAGPALNTYRIIDPATWSKVVGRVNGANFGSIYGGSKAMAYKDITLPEGHTWESYTKFLLSTLPPDIRDHYIKNFKTSKVFWRETGGGFSDEVIQEIRDRGYKIRENGVSNYSKDKKTRIVFDQETPDNTDDVLSTKDIPSWKRMCICILKNDYYCRFMGFGPTKKEQEKINAIKKKYLAIARGR